MSWAAERVGEMERQKCLLVEAFGMGLKLGGTTWMPPQLRREVYEVLGLRVTVSADGGMWAEARVDQTVIRYGREVERYARALREADERIGSAPPEPHEERLERIECELARVRRELASPTVTDNGNGRGGRIGRSSLLLDLRSAAV